MAIVLKDRVKVSAATTGTGAITLGAAVAGFQNFSVIGSGSTTYYTIALQSGDEWEVGIGTVTDTAGTFTLSRDTILESSNSGSLVDFSAGTKEVFVTYPAERAVFLDEAGAYPLQNTFDTLNATTVAATTATLTNGTVSTTPATDTDIANKLYVDNLVASGIHFHAPVRLEHVGNLVGTYNNGASGVGATLTNSGTQAVLTADGVEANDGDRILFYDQTDATQNGVYVVTDKGSISTNWVLTRSDDTDTYGLTSPNTLGEGSTFFVQQGLTAAGEMYTCNTVGTITFGTTDITFAQISSAQIYSAGTGLSLSGTVFSITNTGTAGTYGSLSTVPVFTTNAQGQVTAVTNTAIGITSAAVSGLAASATTDTTNASNITLGTLPSGRINGSYTGITGVGTLAAGTWNGGVIAAAYGGTGQSSYTVGDLLYASGATALSKLADVATGNALLSGGVGTAPAWGKIALTTHVSGTLPIGNGGTGSTDAAGARTGLGASTIGSNVFTLTNPSAVTFPRFNADNTVSALDEASFRTAIGAGTSSTTGTVTSVTGGSFLTGGTITTSGTLAVDATSDNTASKVVARDASGNFSAGTITAALSGNATTSSSTTGNAATATALQTARTINGVSFNGTANISVNTNNAATFNNGGAGAASGSTFNGSSALTVSYNTVGAPSTTGTGASGTWGISISGASASTAGNAATATALQTARAIGGVSFDGTANINLPGVNAVGNQSTTGNAATATTLATARTINGVSFDGSANITVTAAANGGTAANITSQANSATITASTAATANQIVLRDGNGDDYRRYGFADYFNMSHGVSGNTGDTIFYSSGDNYIRKNNATGFRASLNVPTRTGGDASGTWAISVTGSSASTTGNSATATALSSGQSNWNGTGVLNNVVGMLAWKNYGNSHVIFDASNSTTPSGGACNNTNPQNSWGGTYPTLMGWNGSNTYGVRVDSARTADQLGGYAASTFVGQFGNSYYQVNTWLQFNGTHGLYWPSYYGAHLHANDLSTYTQLAIRGSKNSYGGFYDQFSAVNGMMYDSGGNGGVYREANGRWYFYYNLANACMGIGSSATTAGYVLQANGNFYATGNILAGGNITAYSDERLKKDWATLPSNFVEELAKVKSGTYTRIDSNNRQAGSSAQDWQKLLPEVVQEETDAAKTLSLAYGNAALVSAIELAKRVVEQDARIAKLEALVAQLVKGNTP